jgi:hypothetical protein
MQARKKLQNTKYGKYITKIENVIEKFSNAKVLKLLQKLEKINLENPKYKKFKDILVFIKAKTLDEIKKRKLK